LVIVLFPDHFDSLELSFGNLKEAINEKTRLSENAKSKKWFSKPAQIFSWKYHKSDLYILLTPIFLFSTTSWALNNASLNGTYVLYDMQTAFSGQDSNGGWGVNNSASISRVEVTFNGAGSWSGTSTWYDLVREISEVQKDLGGGDHVLSNKFTVSLPDPTTEPASGTYTAGSDGSVSITHSEGTEQIFVSADSSVFLIRHRNSNSTPYAWISMGIGVKKTSAPCAMPWIPLLLLDD
jgi:hypothetical protein